MRILYLTQYFPPEIGATQIRASEMTLGLTKAGHEVTVITEFPNHPTGIIPPEYRRKILERSSTDGVEVIRIWVKASPKKDFRNRLLFYLSYMVMAAFAGLFLVRGKFDAVYASSPPLFVGGAALVISYLRGIPMFFEVRDLWPESAMTLGQLQSPRVIRWATWFEERCYSRARKIIVTAQETVDRLVERGQPADKVALVRNGANVTLFKKDDALRISTREALGLGDKYVLLYAGLHGLAYDLEGVLEVATDLQAIDDVHFLFVGDGPTKTAAIERAKELNLSNATFLPAVPREEIVGLFNAADVTLVPMSEPHVIGTLPIKIYDSMACEVPVIASASGEVGDVVKENGAGIVTPPEDHKALKEAILHLRANPALAIQMGQSGRIAVESKYSREVQAKELVAILEEVLDRN